MHGRPGLACLVPSDVTTSPPFHVTAGGAFSATKKAINGIFL